MQNQVVIYLFIITVVAYSTPPFNMHGLK